MATDLERLVVQLSADIKSYENALNRALGVTNKQARAIEGRFEKLNKNVTKSLSFGPIGGAIAGLGGAFGVREIANYADAWTEAGNKIRAAAEIAGVSTRSLDALKEGANDARTDLTAYVDLYAKLIRSASGVAKSEQEIADATNIVSKAFKAGGASANEQAAGILQLGQALGSGILQGDELRSLRENAPLIAQAIAQEFDTTIAGLKKLGAEGELTSARVFKAILAAQEPIEAAFSQTNATIRDAITQLNNEFTAYIGNADASAGASQRLVQALQFLADNFKEVGDVVVQFATVIISALTGRAIAGLVVGLGQAVAALGAFLTALRTGTLVAAGFSAALGPLGLVAGAAAAAIFLLYDAFGSSDSSVESFTASVASNEGAMKSLTAATYGQVKALRDLIAMQAQAARAAAIQADADFNVALGRRNAFRDITGGYDFAPLVTFTNEAAEKANQLGFAAGMLEDQLAKVDAALAGKNPDSGFGGGVSSGGGSGKAKKDKEDAFEREIRQIQERTATLVAETEAQSKINPLINDYGYAIEKARAKQELLNAAKKAGVEITPALAANIEKLASGYAAASADAEKLAEKQENLRAAVEDFKSTTKDVLSGFVSDLRDGVDAAEALSNALDKIADKLIDAALDSAINALFAGVTGGGGGIFGALFGGKGFADGGYTGSGGKHQPAGVVHAGEYVFSKKAVDRVGAGNLEAMHRAAKGYAEGGLVTPASLSTRIGGPAAGRSTETIRVELYDDSGRMASIADQRIQTASGSIVQVSVQQSRKAIKDDMPGLIANTQARKM